MLTAPYGEEVEQELDSREEGKTEEATVCHESQNQETVHIHVE